MRQALAFLIVLVSAGTASSASIVDQRHDVPGGYAQAIGAMFQVFTVGHNGRLDRIEVPLQPASKDRRPDGAADVDLRLVRTFDGKPSYEPNDVLAHEVIRIPDATGTPLEFFRLEDFQWITFDIQDLPVAVGDQLAIAIGSIESPSAAQNFFWAATFPSQQRSEYAGGQPWTLHRPDGGLMPIWGLDDLVFRTYITPVPEPTSLHFWVWLAAVSAAFRRRK